MKLITASGSLNSRLMAQRSLLGLLILFIAIWSLLPLYWIFITGLKPSGEVYLYPPSFFPRQPTIESIRYIFTERPFGFYLRNSAIVAVSTVIVSTGFAILAGYGFAKFHFRGKGLLLLLILLTRTTSSPR